jgi:acyl carrier protein
LSRRDRIHAVIAGAIEGIRDTLPARLDTTQGAPILETEGGSLDSLGVVNLMVELESRLEAEFDQAVSLAPALALPAEESPFRTVTTLGEYLEGVLPDEGHD